MKKLLGVCFVTMMALTGQMAAIAQEAPAAAAAKPAAYNFGDFKSSTLVTKAWEAFNNKDIEAVLAYTNKCAELFGGKAKEMQASLTDYPTGSNDDVFKYWAVNDVATAYFIQGEAYRQANMKEEAKEAYTKVVKDYTYGQCWDVKGWFWKPAEAAKEKLAALEAGTNFDFGDYTSSTLVSKAWAALAANDLAAVTAYVNKTTEMYAVKAHEMQAALKDYASGSNEEIFKNWALNDVGTALFILGEANRTAGKKDDAIKAYKKLVDEYSYAQAWDNGGWFWKPAEAAQKKIGELENA